MSKRALVVSTLVAVGLAGGVFAEDAPGLHPVPESMTVRELVDGRMVCRHATPDEERLLSGGVVPLSVIYPERGQVRLAAGLQITILATAQLEANPTAKAAFIRAAQTWESHIANPVNVTIKADFGPTRFGAPYPSASIMGSTNPIEYSQKYSVVRSRLVQIGNTQESELYNSLPNGAVPTDIGAASQVLVTQVQLKTLGLSVADNALPEVAFNSAFSFDFDPSNGITANQIDFDAVAVHEMGHILGFASAVGRTEAKSGNTVALTIWDLFRFRPGVSLGNFRTAQRALTPGGEHVSFLGNRTLPMSTGRPDGTGGDGRTPNHWKDDAVGIPLIGLMDPTTPPSQRFQLTPNDLDAFSVMGYTISDGGGTPALPAAPTGLTAVAQSSTSVVLSWTDNASNETSYIVERRSGGGAFTEVAALGANATTATATGLTSGVTYTFRVKARNAVGDSTPSNEASATPTGGGGPPAPPTNLTATVQSSASVVLNWTDNASNETNYIVDRRSGGGAYTEIAVLGANVTTTTATGLTAGVTYTFRVRARNALGDSAPSNEASATPTGGGPACTPSATTVCLVSGRFRVSIAYRNQFAIPPTTGNFVAARLNPAATSPDTALFGFASPNDVEAVVRIVDARPFAPRFDVYYGGLTDVEYTVSVTDTATSQTKTFRNNPGQVGGGVDRSTFPAGVFGGDDRLLTSGGHAAFPASVNGVVVTKGAAPPVRTVLDAKARVQRKHSAPTPMTLTSIGGGGGCSESEPNESTADADPLALSAPCTGNVVDSDPFGITINYEGGDSDGVEDLFKIVLPAAARVTSSLTFTSSGDLDLFLFSMDGNTLTLVDISASVEGTSESFTTDATLPAGTYYIGVSAYAGASSYTVVASAQTSGGGCSESEPNDDTASADPLALGVPCTGTAADTDPGSIDLIGDVEDVFRIVLNSAARVSASLEFNAGADLDLFLFSLNGSTPEVIALSASVAQTVESFTTETLPAGTYYIGVSAFSGSSSYTVMASAASTGGCSESEPNDDIAGADPLALGVPCSGSASDSDGGGITIDNGYTDVLEDVFRIELPTAAQVTASLTFGVTGDLDLFLFTMNGNTPQIIAGSASGSGTQESFTTEETLPAGTYYIGVTSFVGSSSYTVLANADSMATPPAAPTALTARLTAPTTANLTWTDNSSDETDFLVEAKIGTGSFTPFSSFAANTTSADLTGLQPSRTYTFRVKARNASGDSTYSNEASVTTTSGIVCTTNLTTACLNNNRFRVSIAYRNQFANPPATGNFVAQRLNPAATNPDTALFGFSVATDVEVIVRLVDARPFAPRFDVYYGGLTDVEYTVTVTDTVTGTIRTYQNSPGQVGGGVDRASFPAN
jgi:hypothetical protein